MHLLVPTTFLSLILSTTAHYDVYRDEYAPVPERKLLRRKPSDETGFYFDAFESNLSLLQNRFWNGTCWPSTIQWISAFLNTLVASSGTTFTNVLQEYNGQVFGAQTTPQAIVADVQRYSGENKVFYAQEDVLQIFGAAYDDMQWVTLEWLAVLEFLSDYEAYAGTSLDDSSEAALYAHRAHVFYNRVATAYDTSLCGGGVTWNPALATYKNAITNELFMSSSIAMYLYWPGNNDTDPYPTPDYTPTSNSTFAPLPYRTRHDPVFLDNAKQEWIWFKTHNFTNAQGLIVDGFHISSGQSSCDERNEMVYTYNQGVLLSGLRGLWEATGDSTYLGEGYTLVETVIAATGWNGGQYSTSSQWAGLGRAGILEDYCDASASCGQDNLMFKGIYFHHLDLFCKSLPTTAPTVPGVTVIASRDIASRHTGRCQGYLAWIQHNAQAALSTKDQDGVMGNWWAAGYASQTSGHSAVALPLGALDYRNNPAILTQPIFQGLSFSRNKIQPRQASSNGQTSGTVETQGSGVSVLKIACDGALGT